MIIASGDSGPTYTEVRYLNGLTSTEYSDAVVDQHLAGALDKVQNALKITISTSTNNISAVEFNSKDMFFDKFGRMSLYLADFCQSINYLPLLTVTLVEIRTDEDSDYETETEGSDDDYTIDLIRNAIHFNYRLSSSGYKNIRITGTYGIVSDPLTDLELKYKTYIALIAAIEGLRYASGSGFNDSKSVSAGQLSASKDEFATTSRKSVEDLEKQLKEHIAYYGLTRRKTKISIG